MKKFLYRVLLLLLLIVMKAGIAVSQAYQPNGEVDALRVGGNVYMLRANSKIGNPSMAASIGEDGILLVDSSFASFGDRLTARLKELGGGRVKFVINTHWHGDHTGGNEYFGADATILARTKVRARLLKQGILEDNGRLIARRGLPAITFDADFSVYFNGEEVKVMALQGGHTDGDAIVYFTRSNVLCVGDYFFVQRFPVIDVEESGADLEGYLKNIKLIIDRFPSDAKLIPGHAGFAPEGLKVFTMNDLKEYYRVLLETIEIVRRKIRAGASLERIQKEGLPAKFNSYEERPRFVPAARWIESIYKTYARK